MRSHAQPMLATAITLLLLCGGMATAQDASPNEHADQPSVDAGLQRVRVTLAKSGREINGRLVELSGDAVRILVDGKATDLPLTDVRRIDVEKSDSLKNGAVIGAVVLGAWCTLVCGQGVNSAIQVVPAIAVNAGLGALIGAGIDAGQRERTMIYPHQTVFRNSDLSPRVAISYSRRF
jgi:hypothetical protein